MKTARVSWLFAVFTLAACGNTSNIVEPSVTVCGTLDASSIVSSGDYVLTFESRNAFRIDHEVQGVTLEVDRARGKRTIARYHRATPEGAEVVECRFEVSEGIVKGLEEFLVTARFVDDHAPEPLDRGSAELRLTSTDGWLSYPVYATRGNPVVLERGEAFVDRLYRASACGSVAQSAK